MNLETVKIVELNNEQIDRLNKLFSVVAKANGFVLVKDDVYQDEFGRRYFLDALGFHTTVQFSNLELPKKEKELNALINKYKMLIEGDLMGNKSKHKVNKILSRKELPDKEKVRLISKHLNK